MRRRVIVAAVAVALAFGAVGCSQDESPAARSASTAPPCDGVATSEYGLGDAIHRAAPSLASLPTRFSTGTGTVTPDDGTGELIVVLDLCGPGADETATKDAATLVAQQVAESDSLGNNVASMTVVNPATGRQIIAEPFDAPAFAADAGASDLRAQWRVKAA